MALLKHLVSLVWSERSVSGSGHGFEATSVMEPKRDRDNLEGRSQSAFKQVVVSKARFATGLVVSSACC